MIKPSAIPITLQVALIAFASVLVAHVVAVLIFIMSAPPPPERHAAAARLGTIAKMLAVMPPERRDAIIAAALRSGLPLRLSDANDAALRGAPTWHGLLSPATLAQELAVTNETAALAHVETGSVLAIAVPPGNRWLILDLAGQIGDRTWFGPVIDLVLSTVPLALLSIWAARRVARPLVRLAASAGALGTIDDPVPLPEEGAREIREVSRAFNAVLARLRRFVVDRTRMLAAISHDLRTPLTRLRLRAEALPDPFVREKMLADIMRMNAMITSTLDFIREESRQEPVERLDLAALLQTVCDSYSDAGAEAAYDGPLHLTVASRPQALERAVNNLVENAIKFGDRAAVRLTSAGACAAIEIEDDGPGIPEAEQAEVFKPFTRGNAARPLDRSGAGLGLSIARAIVLNHGGTIDLANRSPRGLRVRVELPVTALA